MWPPIPPPLILQPITTPLLSDPPPTNLSIRVNASDLFARYLQRQGATEVRHVHLLYLQYSGGEFYITALGFRHLPPAVLGFEFIPNLQFTDHRPRRPARRPA